MTMMDRDDRDMICKLEEFISAFTVNEQTFRSQELTGFGSSIMISSLREFRWGDRPGVVRSTVTAFLSDYVEVNLGSVVTVIA